MDFAAKDVLDRLTVTPEHSRESTNRCFRHQRLKQSMKKSSFYIITLRFFRGFFEMGRNIQKLISVIVNFSEKKTENGQF